MSLKVLSELTQVHRALPIEVDLSHEDGRLNVDHLLFDVLSVLENTGLSLLEFINGLLTVPDILRDREREPVVVVATLVHPTVQLADLLVQELLLNGLQVAQSSVVPAEELRELIDMAHVVLVLESDIDNGLRDVLSDAVEELGLTDDDLELWGEVYSISCLSSSFLYGLGEDVLLQQADGGVSILLVPLAENLVLIVSIKLLGKGDILESDFFADIVLEEAFLGLELIDWSLYAAHDRASPCNSARLGRHVL